MVLISPNPQHLILPQRGGAESLGSLVLQEAGDGLREF
jgi:hypothetical protein